MSQGSSRLPGGLCVVGQLGRILGCLRDPPDCLEGLCDGTAREDPGMS